MRLSFAVSDPPEAAALVAELGGRILSEIHPAYVATVEDDQGVPIGLWTARGPQPGPRAAEAPSGEIGHVSIQVPDAAKATRFYARLLGWTLDEPFPGYPHVRGSEVGIGIRGGSPEPGIGLAIRVDDLRATVEAARRLGAAVDDPAPAPSGDFATGTDPDGNEFTLWQPAPGF